jgi:prepilin peptidase CpaA
MDVARGVALSALLAVACVSDLRSRRIPNRLVLVTAAIGIVFAVAGTGWIGGLARSGGGLGTGLVIWFPFFAFGMLGAGDVKLFAASATFLGARAAVEGALYTALYGGLLAAVYMVVNSGWSAAAFRIGHAAHQPMLLRQTSGRHGRRLPYALAISAVVLTALWLPVHIFG